MGNILLRPTLRFVGIAFILSAAFAACSNQSSANEPAPSATQTDNTALTAAPAASTEQTATVCDSVAPAADSVQTSPASVTATEPEKAPEPAKEVAAAKPRGDNGIYSTVEHQAEFPGGEGAMLQFINKNLQYPKEAGSQGIQGRVLIDFVVEKDGSLSNFGVLRSPSESLSQEAIRVARLMPKWKPGEMQGKIVRSRYVLPVQFHL